MNTGGPSPGTFPPLSLNPATEFSHTFDVSVPHLQKEKKERKKHLLSLRSPFHLPTPTSSSETQLNPLFTRRRLGGAGALGRSTRQYEGVTRSGCPPAGHFSSGVRCLPSLRAEEDLAIYFFKSCFCFCFFLTSSSSSRTDRLGLCVVFVFLCFCVCPDGHCMALDHHDNHPRQTVDVEPVASPGRSESWAPPRTSCLSDHVGFFVNHPLYFKSAGSNSPNSNPEH